MTNNYRQMDIPKVPVAEQRISGHLMPEETLIWSGAPSHGIQFRLTDLLVVPFTILWGGFALTWTFMAFQGGAPLLFKVVGLVFSLIGIYLIVGRFVMDMLIRRNTFYGITDQRVLINEQFFRSSLKSTNLSNLGEVQLKVGKKGSGSVIFGHPNAQQQAAAMFRLHSAGFEHLADAKLVHGELLRAQRLLIVGPSESQRPDAE